MIKGLDKLLVKLDNITNKESVVKGLEIACTRVEIDAKENAPVDDGILRASITHEIDENNLVGYVGTNVKYAPYVEFGTGIYAADGNGRKTPWSYKDAKGEWHTTVGQQPQPFLYPALAKNIDKIVKDIKQEIRRRIVND